VRKTRVWIALSCCLIFVTTIAFAQEMNQVASGGSSPLVDASISGNIEVVRDLIEKGADVNGRDEQGSFPLYAAVVGDHADVVELLIKKGANVNQSKAGDVLPKIERNTTALHAASIIGNQAVVELLVSAAANVNAFADLNQENAKNAKKILESPLVSKLLTPESVILFKAQLGENGVTPLALASRFGHADIAAILLDRGADINFQKPGDNTALIEAAIAGRRDVIDLLVSRKADLNRVGEDGGTALALALLNEQYESAGILLAAGADFQLTDRGKFQWKRPFSWGAFQLLAAEKLTAEGRGAETKKMLTDALASLTAARDELNKAVGSLNQLADKADQLADKLDKDAKSADRWATVLSLVSGVIAPRLTDYSRISSQRQTAQIVALKNSKTSGQYFSNFERLEAGGQPGPPQTPGWSDSGGGSGSLSSANLYRNSAGLSRKAAGEVQSRAQVLKGKVATCDSLVQRVTKLLNDAPGIEKAP